MTYFFGPVSQLLRVNKTNLQNRRTCYPDNSAEKFKRPKNLEIAFKMLVLFETPAGFAIFKLLDEKKLQKSENLYQDFASVESAKKVIKLKSFEKFEDTSKALASAASLIEGKMSKDLKKFLKGVFAKDAHEKLAVADAKLGQAIKSKLEIDCVADSSVSELMRCIRSQLSNIMPSVDDNDLKIMSLGLGHSLSRYKLKFSPDKIDTMIVQVSKSKV